MKSSLLFIHIAKTGGASIRRVLNESNMGCSYHCLHNGALIFRDAGTVQRIAVDHRWLGGTNRYEKVAYFVRNPYDRLLSCYSYFYHGGLNQYGRGRFPADDAIRKSILERFPDFDSCCRQPEAFCDVVPHAKSISSCLPKFLDDESAFVGYYENFESDAAKLFHTLDIQSRRLPHLNRSTNPQSFSYSAEGKSSVREFYRDDFLRFGYSEESG